MRIVSEDALAIITIFQEAEGEPYEGKVAVGEVILRRTAKKYRSDGTVAGTVLRRYQFSGMNSDAPNRSRSFSIDNENPVVLDCVKAWEEAKSGSCLTGEALHYYNPITANPLWAIGARVEAQIGRHRFVVVNE